jgi:hypothetical protein
MFSSYFLLCVTYGDFLRGLKVKGFWDGVLCNLVDWWQHNINARNKHHLHRPVANLSCFQKGKSYSGIRIFNSLLRQILRMKRHSLK